MLERSTPARYRSRFPLQQLGVLWKTLLINLAKPCKTYRGPGCVDIYWATWYIGIETYNRPRGIAPCCIEETWAAPLLHSAPLYIYSHLLRVYKSRQGSKTVCSGKTLRNISPAICELNFWLPVVATTHLLMIYLKVCIYVSHQTQTYTLVNSIFKYTIQLSLWRRLYIYHVSLNTCLDISIQIFSLVLMKYYSFVHINYNCSNLCSVCCWLSVQFSD